MSSRDPMSRYKFEKNVGKGSYGKVSLCRDTKTQELVILKTIAIKNSDQNARKQAQKEATLLNMLRHPNVITYIDSFYNNAGDFCIVLEYADGKDLQKFLESHSDEKKALSEKKVLQIFTQIILGLDYIHSQNILHRDIKTANVFLFKKGLVKLGDFGISRQVGEDESAKTMIGTPYFMCPELLKGQRYSFPADVWAAGCVLFEMLTHKHAFTGTSREELFANITSGKMGQLPTNYSKELIDLLKSMLNQDPDKRPTCKEILATDIIGKGLNALQAKLVKNNQSAGTKASAPKSRLPSRQSSGNSSARSKKSSASASRLETTDDDEIDQSEMPEWLKDDQSVCDELIRQSQKHLEKDSNWLLGVIRSSISMKQSKMPEVVPSDVDKLTGNVEKRRDILINEAKKGLGDKFDKVYKFIKENGQEKRNELISELGLGASYGKELKMVEIITAIEELA